MIHLHHLEARGGVLILPDCREMFDTVHPVFLIQVVLCNPLLLEDYVTPRPLIVCIEDNEKHLAFGKLYSEERLRRHWGDQCA